MKSLSRRWGGGHGEKQPDQSSAVVENRPVAINRVAELVEEGIEASTEIKVADLAVFQPRGEIRVVADDGGEFGELTVAAQTQHGGSGEEVHELVRVVRPDDLVVELAEKTDAVRKRDELPPVDIDPPVVDGAAVLDLGCKPVVVESCRGCIAR